MGEKKLFGIISLDLNRADAIETLYRGIYHARLIQPDAPLTIDLSPTSFVPADGVLALVTAARLWHRWTGRRTLLTGMRQKVHQYLERMDLFTTCGDWLKEEQEIDPCDRYGRARASLTLLEVMPVGADPLQNADDVGDAVARAERILTTWFGADAQEITRLLTVLAEVASNVVHSTDRGFALIQRYRDPTPSFSGGRVTLAVADLGIGIEASLRSKPDTTHVPSGAAAILRALDLGVTSRDTVGGLGLACVKGIVDDWQGTLTIRTFQSSVHFAGGEVTLADELSEIPGTQVTIKVRGTGTEGLPF